MTIRGALYGDTLVPKLRYGDLENKISLGTAGAFLAKDRFKEHNPFSRQYNDVGDLTILMNLHFLAEVRRQLSGTEEPGTSTFSPEELTFWNEFIDYQNGGEKTGELLLALETLDKWILDEVMHVTHPELERDYSATHKWNKTAEYEYTAGIKWI